MLSCFAILLQVAAYDTVAKEMAFFDPSRSQDFLFISGTKVGSPQLSFSFRTSSGLLLLTVDLTYQPDAHLCQNWRESSRRFHVPGWVEGSC
jgi:hypothetical protein